MVVAKQNTTLPLPDKTGLLVDKNGSIFVSCQLADGRHYPRASGVLIDYSMALSIIFNLSINYFILFHTIWFLELITRHNVYQ